MALINSKGNKKRFYHQVTNNSTLSSGITGCTIPKRTYWKAKNKQNQTVMRVVKRSSPKHGSHSKKSYIYLALSEAQLCDASSGGWG